MFYVKRAVRCVMEGEINQGNLFFVALIAGMDVKIHRSLVGNSNPGLGFVRAKFAMHYLFLCRLCAYMASSAWVSNASTLKVELRSTRMTPRLKDKE